MSRNIKLTIAYDGTDYCGWQRQPDHLQDKWSGSINIKTIQGVIENALEKLHGKQVNLTGSGRTDSGVHAVGQIANFCTDMDSIPADRFVPTLNSLLPHDIRILNSCEVNSDFHSRFSAKMRTYRYQFICRTILPHENRHNLQLNRKPSLNILNAYGRLLHGEIDCSIFAGAGDRAIIEGKSRNRYIYRACFYMENSRLIFEICANAFLRSMVRSVAGTFLHYEETATPVEKLREIIASGDRSLAGPTLPPQGLFLWHVDY